MLVTSSGMTVVEHPTIRALLLVSIIALHPPRESYTVFSSSTVMEVRLLLQPEKAPFPMLVTPLGMVMEVRLPQPAKASAPILVNFEFSGKVMEVMLHISKASSPMLVTLSGIVMEARTQP